MRTFLFALAACAAAWAAPAVAQTTPTTYAFQTVDAVKLEGSNSYFRVTGILVGESAPVEKLFVLNGTSGAYQLDVIAQCERMAMLSMARPGYYLFEITPATSSFATPTCKLSRAVP